MKEETEKKKKDKDILDKQLLWHTPLPLALILLIKEYILIPIYGYAEYGIFVDSYWQHNYMLLKTTIDFSTMQLCRNDDYCFLMDYVLTFSLKHKDSWMSIESTTLHVTYHRHAVCATKNHIYVLGGYRNNTYSQNSGKECEMYDIQQNKWSSFPSLKVSRLGAAAVAHNNQVFVFGGYDDVFLASAECCNIEEKKWKGISEMTVARSDMQAVVWNSDTIAVLGGRTTNGETDRVDFYHLSTDHWSIPKWKLPMPMIVFFAQMIVETQELVVQSRYNFMDMWILQEEKWESFVPL